MLHGLAKLNRIQALSLTAAPLVAILSPAGPANAKNTASARQAVAYAQCMRENGFASFPKPDSEGRILLRERLDDRSKPAFRAAHAVCNAVAPPGWASEHPDRTRKAKLTGFAQCVRSQGVKNFPNPNAAGAFDFERVADSAVLRVAMKTCRHRTGVSVGYGG